MVDVGWTRASDPSAAQQHLTTTPFSDAMPSRSPISAAQAAAPFKQAATSAVGSSSAFQKHASPVRAFAAATASCSSSVRPCQPPPPPLAASDSRSQIIRLRSTPHGADLSCSTAFQVASVRRVHARTIPGRRARHVRARVPSVQGLRPGAVRSRVSISRSHALVSRRADFLCSPALNGTDRHGPQVVRLSLSFCQRGGRPLVVSSSAVQSGAALSGAWGRSTGCPPNHQAICSAQLSLPGTIKLAAHPLII